MSGLYKYQINHSLRYAKVKPGKSHKLYVVRGTEKVILQFLPQNDNLID